MKRLISLATFTVAALGLLAGFTGAAAAETQGPIDFESYSIGNIDGQQGWMKTGGYDAAVASVASFPAAAGYGFGDQALRLSDAVTTGSFGDQTFSPSLAQPAGEGLPQTHFQASFKIGSATGAEQTGLHMSVSPDNGSGGRMSYLRFEDHPTNIAVYFDDVTDPGPFYTEATFSDALIATLSYGSAHTIGFAMDFKPGPANDVVRIVIDGSVVKIGTSWEDYYRYDNEHQGTSTGAVPTTSSLLFREAGEGDAHTGNLGKGYLVDGVALASSASAVCTPTGFVRDNMDLTAAQIGGNVTGDLDATGCDIGVYYGPGTAGATVHAATIHGARYFGVVNDGGNVAVTNSTISNIGDVPFNGSQHGVAVFYTTEHVLNTPTGAASGTISGNVISQYQKGGITARGKGVSATIQNNRVTGLGHVDFIAQNGIQISFGASATVTGNTVSGNWYTPASFTACGLLFFDANGVKQSKNNLFDNETNLCNFGRGGGNTSA
jgi:hypothetical protein